MSWHMIWRAGLVLALALLVLRLLPGLLLRVVLAIPRRRWAQARHTARTAASLGAATGATVPPGHAKELKAGHGHA